MVLNTGEGVFDLRKGVDLGEELDYSPTVTCRKTVCVHTCRKESGCGDGNSLVTAFILSEKETARQPAKSDELSADKRFLRKGRGIRKHVGLGHGI
jgi:hypothetical protein